MGRRGVKEGWIVDRDYGNATLAGRKQAGQINSKVVQFSTKKKVTRDAGSGNAARENELDSHLTMNNVCQRNCGEF